MLQSYEAIFHHGELRWVDPPPPLENARVIVTVLPAAEAVTAVAPTRLPPTRLRDTGRTTGDIVEPLISDQELNGMLERTLRQLAGNPD